MGSTHAIDQRHIGIRHPKPNPEPWRLGKGLSANGRYASRRVIDALKAEEDAGYTDGMTPDELASALSVAPSEAQKMAWSCWMSGLVVFDIEWGDIVFRLVKD